jgi:predicted transcriptional regulator
MNIGELCNREVVVVKGDTSIQEAAKLMRDHHVGNLVVIEEQNSGAVPIGIITDRDIVIEVIAEDVELDALTVADVMSYELLTANDDDAIVETIKRMRRKGVRRVPVINSRGSLEGIVAVDDLIDLIAEEIFDLVSLIGREQRLEREKRG